jgi:hypothetical protein
MNLQIHLIQSFLHVPYVLSPHLNEVFPMAPMRADGADDSGRAEALPQQPDRVQVLNPLAVGYVGLPPWDVLYVLCINQIHLKPAFFENLMQWDPVHADGFHSDRSDAALLQPVGKALKIAGKRGKSPNRLFIPVRGNGNEDLFSADICTCRIRLQNMQRRCGSPFVFLCHGTSIKGPGKKARGAENANS